MTTTHPNIRRAFATAFAATLFASPLTAGTTSGKAPQLPAPSASAPAVDLLTGEGVSLGGVLFPHVHFNAVYGGTSAHIEHGQGAAHHDPVTDGWTIQGLELGMSGRFGKYVEAFGVLHAFYPAEKPRTLTTELEEYFLKLHSLPGGLEVRGGRMLNRFGLHNPTHQHAWNFVDTNLVDGRILGEHGLRTDGAELSWTPPLPWTSMISVAAGNSGYEAEEEEDEEGHIPAEYEGHGAVFDGSLVTANWTNLWNINDFHSVRIGVSGAWGDNAGGGDSSVYAAHFQYEWRRNGLDAGGDYFRWKTEAMWREFEAAGESGKFDTLDDSGVSCIALYGTSCGQGVVEAGLRYDYLQGVPNAEFQTRHRISPQLTCYLNQQRTAHVRSQYNYDHISGGEGGHSVWLGFGLNWGGAEVR